MPRRKDSFSVNVITVLAWLLCAFSGVAATLLRCESNQDCPPEGACYQDECARCLCPMGMLVIDLWRDGAFIKTCQLRAQPIPKVGEVCRERCVSGSHCNKTTVTCTCDKGLKPHHDNQFCRQASYGESCDSTHTCADGFGLTCGGLTGVCDCVTSHRRPSPWSNFILSRWNYTQVSESPQECVIRAVGEPCLTDEHCNAVGGSGSICGPCAFCECRVQGHVPDVLGTKCGPGLQLDQSCQLHAPSVCDGSRGLQCGDVCSLYAYDLYPKRCSCSQMHIRQGNICVPKTIGDECSTDLDCYPVGSGFGYCHHGLCRAYGATGDLNYAPYLVNRQCLPDSQTTAIPNLPITSEEVRHNTPPEPPYITRAADGDIPRSYSIMTVTLEDTKEWTKEQVMPVTQKEYQVRANLTRGDIWEVQIPRTEKSKQDTLNSGACDGRWRVAVLGCLSLTLLFIVMNLAEV